MLPFNDGTVADAADYPLGTKIELAGREYDIDESVVGIQFTRDGDVEDLLLGWETCVNFADGENFILILRGDAHLSQDELQRGVDHESRVQADFHGEDLW